MTARSKRAAATLATPQVVLKALPAKSTRAAPTQRAQLEALQTENLALRAKIEALEAENRTLQIERVQPITPNELDVLRDAIIHNVSHEMKTPLLHVKAAVANLAEQYGGNKSTEYAMTATARLEGIIRNISLLAGSTDIHPTPALLRDSVEYAIRNLRRSWEHRDQVNRVQTHFADDLPPVLMDGQAMGIALQLLLDNALKFSKPPTPITINATLTPSEPQRVYVEIVDCGIGIPQDQIDKIFEAFYMVDSSSTRRFNGVGVGLAIVRLIMERHGAAITVKSEPGKGSTFCFTLPCAALGR